MEVANTIQKSIGGNLYRYDRVLDVIYTDSYEHGTRFDRTQVDHPVDLCLESTTWCNWECKNCFSSSARGRPGRHVDVDWAVRTVEAHEDEIIRVCVTGGEPFTHPRIEELLRLPERISGCGFVVNTNGTLRPELDDLIAGNRWLTALSLHGGREAHEWYSRWGRFDEVTSRIERLAARGIVHVYTVLHDQMTADDLDWLLRFRDESGAAFLRFIVPRQFGRYRPLRNEWLVGEVEARLDARSGLKDQASKTRFLSVHGISRTTN